MAPLTEAFPMGAGSPALPAPPAVRIASTPLRATRQAPEQGVPLPRAAAAVLVATGVMVKRSGVARLQSVRCTWTRRMAGKRATAVAMRAEQSQNSVAEVEELEPFFEEVSGDDPLVLDLEDRLREMNGASNLTLDMVLNPGTIVNTEREVILLRAQLKATPDEDTDKRKKLEDKIEEKQMKIVNEMKLVMTDNLKLEFLVQAVLSIFAFGFMCYDAFPWIPDLTWAGINKLGSKLALKLFGVWGLWLFTVPALRARKPGGPYGMGYEEKRALDLSFLVLPFVCIFGPILFKDASTTFWLSLLTLAGLYGWSFNTPLVEGKIQRGAGQDLNLPEPVMWAIKALDFGTGSERGARSEDKSWQDQLAAYEKAADELAAKKAERLLVMAGGQDSKMDSSCSELILMFAQAERPFGEVSSAQFHDDLYDWPQGSYSSNHQYSKEQSSRRHFAEDEDFSLPSIGSRDHASGVCRPCAWLWKPGGCRNAYQCTHCHLCTPESGRKRRKEFVKEPPAKAQPPQRGKRRQEWTWQQAEEPPSPWIESAQTIPPPPPTTPSPTDALTVPAAPPAPSAGHSSPSAQEESEQRQLQQRWSRGSQQHNSGLCRPCLFQWTASGCKDGQDCEFCHLCVPQKDFKVMPAPMPAPVPTPMPAPAASMPAQLPAMPEWQQANAPAGFRNADQAHRPEAHYINLAERLVPESQAQAPGAQQMTPGLVSSLVLGTAPYPNPQPLQPQQQQYRTASAWQPVPAKMKEFRSVQSPMPMGVVDGPPCFDCGNVTHCVCLPGDVGFSEREPVQHLRTLARRKEPDLPQIVREEDGDARAPGDVGPALERSLQHLMQSGENTGQSASSAGPERISPGEVAHNNGKCQPCVELMQSASCSAGANCPYCHVCLEPRRRKKIGNMALKKKSSDG
ncbi:RPH1 [Symbiodinium natans]|uniref:RPH1 protein n=1 Tax=Symbiodinium natans TaxID=878477 RepID=A0A812RA24_9DINO|nr:RPH1 [Symbiodinium natans]